MSLKSSNRARRPTGNPRLAAAIARCKGSPTPEKRSELLGRLMAAPLLVAIHDLPEEIGRGGETAVRFLVQVRAEGGIVVCGFSSHESLSAMAPSAVGFSIDPATLLDWLIASDCEGLILDPAGASAFVSNDDARQLLGLPRRARGSRRAGVFRGTEKLLHDALERLLGDSEHHRLAIVREPATAKSLRFERGEGDSIRLVLATAPLAVDERERAGVLFEEFAGGADDLPPLEGAPGPAAAEDFVALFSGDLVRPIQAGIKIFTWVFGFQPGIALEIELAGGAGP